MSSNPLQASHAVAWQAQPWCELSFLAQDCRSFAEKPGAQAASWAAQATRAHAEAAHAYILNRARGEGMGVIYGYACR